MSENSTSIIIKFDFMSEQTVGEITKIVGLVKARYLIPIIDILNLEANPRSSRTGSVTEAIQDSIETDSDVFPFKTKGILLASSQCQHLERNRIKIIPKNPEIEGILDGGHNTLAIGLFILKKAIEHDGGILPNGNKNWDEFKKLWQENRVIINEYEKAIKSSPDIDTLDFFVPIELLVPRDANDNACVDSFQNELLEICAARNNNVQLQVSAKANQHGYFDTIRAMLDERNPALSQRIEWKTNDGGDIKAQDIIALAWIPLNLVTSVPDSNGRIIEPVLAQNIYRGKGSCLKQFEKLMSSPKVTTESTTDYRRQLCNPEVESALKIAAELPELYDYIYSVFPRLYNNAGGLYGRITAVKTLNEKRRDKRMPFSNTLVDTLSPEGFIVPLVFGLQALMENKPINGHNEIRWKTPPMPFLHEHLENIVKYYAGIFSMCDYDPQKIGKNPQSYSQTLSGYKMAIAGILS